MAESVHLVDEEDIALVKIREDGCQISRTLYGRPRTDLDADSHLRRDDIGESSLPQTGGAVQYHVVKRFGPLLSSGDGDPEIVLDSTLAYELTKASGAQVRLYRAIIGCCPT